LLGRLDDSLGGTKSARDGLTDPRMLGNVKVDAKCPDEADHRDSFQPSVNGP
jgi:hypothetical protein